MSTEIDALLEKNISALVFSFDRALERALKEYGQLRQTDKKGELSYIYISFLLSGVLCGLPWLRIDLYDENDRADITECSADWDVPCISDSLYRDVEQRAAPDGRRKDYEREQARLELSKEYFGGFEKLLPAILRQSRAAQDLNCQWRFGEYLGGAVAVRARMKDQLLELDDFMIY